MKVPPCCAILSWLLASQSNPKIASFMVEEEAVDLIWFLPHKFWAATRNMPKERADRLLDEVIELAEARNLEALRKYDFVSLENPYPRRVA
jgi:hypothetical protein